MDDDDCNSDGIDDDNDNDVRDRASAVVVLLTCI